VRPARWAGTVKMRAGSACVLEQRLSRLGGAAAAGRLGGGAPGSGHFVPPRSGAGSRL